MSIKWTEKYRPKTLDQVINQKSVVTKLKSKVKERNIPDLLFYGPPGTGKTSCAIALAHDLLGEYVSLCVEELNASDERGIETIRKRVKEFAKVSLINILFKIMILDESDEMTHSAQQALRRIMEKYHQVTRFILIANDKSKIIEPIQSRCADFRFLPLDSDDIENCLLSICLNEKVTIQKEALTFIVRKSNGDLRKAINILQGSTVDNVVSKESVLLEEEELGLTTIQSMLELSLKGDFLGSCHELDSLLYGLKVDGKEIVWKILGLIKSKRLIVDDDIRILIAKNLGQINWTLYQGIDPQIQLTSFLANVCSYSNNYRNKNIELKFER